MSKYLLNSLSIVYKDDAHYDNDNYEYIENLALEISIMSDHNYMVNTYEKNLLKVSIYILRRNVMNDSNIKDLELFKYILPTCINCIRYYINYITPLHRERYNFLNNMLNKMRPLIGV
jgi:hypothetical protein